MSSSHSDSRPSGRRPPAYSRHGPPPGRGRPSGGARSRGPRPPEPPPTSRFEAARIVADWMQRGHFPDRALEQVRTDRAFVMELTLGTIRRFGTLQWLLRSLVPRPPRTPVAATALIGFYQLLYMHGTSVFAAVHETVDAAHRIGSVKDAGLVNALLRRLDRERDAWVRAIEAQPDPIRLSHPSELLHRWSRHFGRRGALKLCAWNNEPPDVTLRLRTGLDARAYTERLHEAGVAARPHPHAPTRVLVLPRGVRVDELPGFSEGLFYVQDPSTLAAVELLDPKPGERVWDACAAPGGKTIHIAEGLAGQGVLVATDKHADRLERLRENLARMGHADTVVVRHVDASRPAPDVFRDVLGDPGVFDAVLLDVPCSNTGVIRRRPDARWHLDRRRLEALTREQHALLDAAWPWVAPGGRLVYSTCSLEPEEDEVLIEAWLRTRSDARFVRAVKLVPHRSGTDGAYAARLVREA